MLDPAVALPYWRFDRAGAAACSPPDFIGAPSGAPSPGGGTAVALVEQPLLLVDHRRAPGIDRHPAFADPRQFAATTSLSAR